MLVNLPKKKLFGELTYTTLIRDELDEKVICLEEEEAANNCV